MRGLPRLHPADVPVAIGQAVAALSVGGWCCWTTYQAAQSWVPTLAERVAMGGAAGGLGVLVTLGGLVCARVAGAQDARRAINEHLEAQARNRAEVANRGGRHRAGLAGRVPGGWPAVNAAPVPAVGRRALDNAGRFALPAGTRGAAGCRMVAELPAGVDLTDGPAEDVDQGGGLPG